MRAFFVSIALTLAACGAPTQHEHNASSTAAAVSPASTVLEVRDAWAPPTPGGVDVSAGYATIANGTDAEDQLLSVSSARAERVELHEMAMDGDIMRMRRVDALAIPAHGEVALAPHSRHLMFFGVTQPFTPGEHIPVTLTFAHAGAVNAEFAVRIGGAH